MKNSTSFKKHLLKKAGGLSNLGKIQIEETASRFLIIYKKSEIAFLKNLILELSNIGRALFKGILRNHYLSIDENLILESLLY
jgi:hypothetical protein